MQLAGYIRSVTKR